MSPDIQLLSERTVFRVTPDLEPPPGWMVVLSCGHEAWFAVFPANRSYVCAQCVNDYIASAKPRNEAPTTP